MGLASDGGFLKLDLRDSIEDWASKHDGILANVVAARRRACGNLEEKGRILWITPTWWRRWYL
jgi:hypothetical protein